MSSHEVSASRIHCMKSVQIPSFFWSVFSPNARKNGLEKAPYLDTFYAVIIKSEMSKWFDVYFEFVK